MSDNCDTNAQCIETNDDFVCRCNDGYEGNGVNCCELMITACYVEVLLVTNHSGITCVSLY